MKAETRKVSFSARKKWGCPYCKGELLVEIQRTYKNDDDEVKFGGKFWVCLNSQYRNGDCEFYMSTPKLGKDITTEKNVGSALNIKHVAAKSLVIRKKKAA